MSQILVNMLSNAVDAMSLLPEVENRLTVRIEASGEHRVRVGVIDNGCGIGNDDLIQLFQYGFTTKSTGHGFGLHSAANDAHLLGGRLDVESDGPGLGSAFWLVLPTRDDSSEEDGSRAIAQSESDQTDSE